MPRKEPYTFTAYDTDWGWRVSGRHDTQGDLSLIEHHEHNPPLTEEASAALWDLLDEQTFETKKAAEDAASAWLASVA